MPSFVFQLFLTWALQVPQNAPLNAQRREPAFADVRVPSLAELRVPAFTAYLAPDPDAARVSRDRDVAPFAKPGTSLLWFGEFRHTGAATAAVLLTVPRGDSVVIRLSAVNQRHDVTLIGSDSIQRVTFGAFDIMNAGYTRFELSAPAQKNLPGVKISALLLDGPATAGAHFNLDARRNAASVHVRYPVDSSAVITGFYNEVTAVDDPVTTYYMATGFARGYFGMQVNSPTERRIIFSVWDAAEGSTAKDRTTVSAENQTHLLAKGDGVVADVFGNEGTGGHSHLVYNWKTGSTQRFFVTAAPNGTFTDYSGYWFHPDKQQWQLIASFRAPKDGQGLRRLYSFSEDFGGSTGHLRRKALYGPAWIRLASGEWKELTTATFSHDATGKENRLDRFMGVEGNRFFLQHGGFEPGFTNAGDQFQRTGGGAPPKMKLPDER